MKPLVKINFLSHQYDKRTTAGVTGLTFSVFPGEIFSLIGPSGSGKTTTLKCLAGIINNYTGHIDFSEGCKISYISQDSKLNNELTVFENLENHLKNDINDITKRENQIRSILAQLEMTNEIYSQVKNISGGQKQRVIIAKALVTNPTFLLLDEPFANLDRTLRTELLEELFDTFLLNDLTIIWVTHNTEEALTYSDRVLLLNYGELQQVGTAKDLFHTPRNMFTAHFFGKTNTIASKLISLDETNISISLLGEEILIQKPQDFNAQVGADILAVIRPDCILLNFNGKNTAVIQTLYFQGINYLVCLSYNDTQLWAYISTKEQIEAGSTIKFDWDKENIYCLGEI